MRGGYGAYYGGGSGDGDDPLTSAIGGVLSGFGVAMDWRREQRKDARQALLDEEERKERARLAERQRVADALAERQIALQEREAADRQAAANREAWGGMMDRGLMVAPTVVGGALAPSLQRIPSKEERASKARVAEALALAEATNTFQAGVTRRENVGAAKAYNIRGADTMDDGQLAEALRIARRRAEERPSASTPAQLITGADGRTYWADPRTRSLTPAMINGQPFSEAASGGPKITAAEREGAAQYQFALPAYERLQRRLYEIDPTTGKPALDANGQPKPRAKAGVTGMDKTGEALKGNWSPDWLGNLLQSDEGQQTFDDLASLVLATQYALSGKAVTMEEARKLARGLVPALGDKPGRAAQKRAEIENRMRVLRVRAGNALRFPQGEGVPDDPLAMLDAMGRQP